MNKTGHSIRVILLDDSSAIRERLSDLLDLLVNVEVVGQAADASSGLDMIAELKPDVLVLDIGLPGLSGIEVLKIVKHKSPDLMVIMLTNYRDAVLRETCLELGADYYFHKPVEFERTLDVCEELAAIRARLCANNQQKN